MMPMNLVDADIPPTWACATEWGVILTAALRGKL